MILERNVVLGATQVVHFNLYLNVTNIMQHVNQKRLQWFTYALAILDCVILGIVSYSFFLKNTLASDHNLSYSVAIIAAIHLIYAAALYRTLARRAVWYANMLSAALYGVLIVITLASEHQLWYFSVLLIIYSFMCAMIGLVVPLAAVAAAWILLLVNLEVGQSPHNMTLSITANALATLAAFAGWYIFRKYYTKDAQPKGEVTNELFKQTQGQSNIILESITDGVMVISAQGTIQLLNSSCAAMLGWTKTDATGLDYRSLVKPTSENRPDEVATSAITTTLQTQKLEQSISLLQTKNQHHTYVDIVASPVFDKTLVNDTPTDTLVGVIAVLRNVDKQKREERQRSDFISTASHEMRTPVASIQGFIELALNPKVSTVDDKARNYLEKAHKATQHLGQLFQDLLTVSKSDDGRLTNKPQLINIIELLQEIVDQERHPAEQKNLKIDFDKGDTSERTIAPLMYVNADPERLREVILNLCDNAIKYTPGGMITVGASLQDQSIVIRVSDTGMGIAQEDIGHLFQKFYRTDNSATREIGGTGLGLYICKQIVDMMQGRIWVESTIGAGSTFYVALPRVSPEEIERLRHTPVAT